MAAGASVKWATMSEVVLTGDEDVRIGPFLERWPELPPWWDRHVFPDSDGRPMADNDEQWRVMVMLRLGLSGHFGERDDLYVGSDLLWYVDPEDSRVNVAPDILVCFGRPPGRRRSWKQWEEGGVGPAVVVEVLSHSNSAREMRRKWDFFNRNGVLEYVIHDPEDGFLEIWHRPVRDGRLVVVTEPDGWTSPLLGVRFDLDGMELVATSVETGRRFPRTEDYAASVRDAEEAKARAEAAEVAAAAAAARAESEAARAESEAARAESEAARAAEAIARADRLAVEIEELRRRSTGP